MVIKILFFLLSFFFVLATSSGQNIKFERISVKQGLSQSNIYCILQDSHGYMWFGSELGLKKFDGYKFINYKHDPNKPESISGNNVRSIIEDKSGSLWITTKDGGLDRFDRKSEKFIHYRITEDDSLQNDIINIVAAPSGNLWLLSANYELYYFDVELGSSKRYTQDFLSNIRAGDNYISKIYVDRQGILWIGTAKKGLIRFDAENELFKQYKYDPVEKSSLSNNSINSITEDKSGNIFIGTYNGLNKFDKKINKFNRYFYEADRAKRGSKSLIRVLMSSKAGLIWFVTGEGLVLFNHQTEEYVNLYQNSDLYNNLKNKTITSIYEDRSGIIWVGTFSGELFKYDPKKIKFIHYKNSPNDPYSLSYDHILDICEDNQGTLWVGTWGGGLNELKANQANKNSPKWINHKHDPLNSKSIGGNSVYNIYEDSKKTLWFNTSNGLFRLVRPSINSTNINDQKNRSSFTRESEISGCMYEDKQNNFWIGTYRGLYKFDRLTKSLTHYAGDPNNPESLGVNEITCIMQSSIGLIWIGTFRSGLYSFDPVTESYSRYCYNPKNPNSLSNNGIHMIYEDNSGFHWITTNKGLNKLEPQTGNFIHFNHNVGLPEDNTFVILPDSKDNLWISTGKGLFRYSPESRMVKSFDTEDGLQSMDFNLWGYKSKNGWMYFSSVYGLIAFHPDSIKFNENIPEIILSDFQVFNKSIKPGPDSPLKKAISQAREIILSHAQSVFSFEFSALDYHSPQKNQYAYKMDGVDPDWVYTDATRRFATYTNLDPGEYIFKVKGSNNDGIWNEVGTSIKILITPPWWETSAAYIFYILILMTIIYTAWRMQTQRLKVLHQLELDHLHVEKLEEVDRMKSHFFANISHEFRTPLTLIQGPVKQILSGEFKGNLKKQCQMILRNSNRLLMLVNQILELSRIESGKMKLKVSQTKIIPFIKGIVHSFESLANNKNINLRFRSNHDVLPGYVDRDKLEKIIINLLGNAFKFTPEGGEVVVDVSRPTPGSSQEGTSINPLPGGDRGVGKDIIQITISNSGPGIKEDQLAKIFDRFYQAENNYKKDSEGTGLGLALAKEFVEVHHGWIKVESAIDNHTSFMVYLPVTKEYFSDEEICEDKAEVPAVIESKLELSPEKQEIPIFSSKNKDYKPLLLIIEDNADVTTFISNSLQDCFHIISAENGKIGKEKAIKKIPDIIISDVMMPEMDGFELCKSIKSDERTSHIPVILITAKADFDSVITGLEFGADDYVTKPFDAKELHARCKNLIEQRKKLREKYSRVFDVNPQDISVTSADEKFLQRIVEIFEKNIANPQYSTEEYASEIGMSRSGLNKKLHALTDLPTHRFILHLRLKRAAKLLKQASGNVSEVAFRVGFSNTSHFAKAFRKQFNLSPSEFLKQNSAAE